MIYGIGTDICDVRRIRASLDRHGDRFAEKVLSEAELAVWRRRSAWKRPPAACSTRSANPGNWMATMRRCCAAPRACTSWG